MTNLILVVGCCRSGTSWLGKALREHPEIRGTHEPPEVFKPVMEMAQDGIIDGRFERVVEYYEKQLAIAEERGQHYCDKSHPNLWLVEEYIKRFPDRLKILGIQRGPYQVVSSMLMHQHSVDGVFANRNKYPKENPFLGTREEHEVWKLSRTQKAALRWGSHKRRMVELVEKIDPGVFQCFDYEQLVMASDTWGQITKFLELRSPVYAPAPDADALYKWSRILKAEQLDTIDKTIENF